ncbi:unnamed protein product [Litomosoides sigmodontis]|uniref:Uncharacterized protein n=1 Tax=Litomosoides sigmodontis TaxID=42156 RepID=A0A3P6TWC6_LITSI|nr:unnamed protein product [Litomosoides sigmodontis]
MLLSTDQFHLSYPLLLLLLSLALAHEANSNGQFQPTLGTKCLPNQVVTKLTVYDDGAIEAECNKLPCGTSGIHCNDNQASCRTETDTFSGMKWASNGQSILQRCCTITVPRKIYIGTDLVSLGSYYTGGAVDQKDLHSNEGPEFDFIWNVRTEQGGVRIWVYRAICPKVIDDISWQSTTVTPQIGTMQHINHKLPASGRHHQYHQARQAAMSSGNDQSGGVATEDASTTVYKPINPLQYRPANWRLLQRDSPLSAKSRDFFERLI